MAADIITGHKIIQPWTKISWSILLVDVLSLMVDHFCEEDFVDYAFTSILQESFTFLVKGGVTRKKEVLQVSSALSMLFS